MSLTVKVVHHINCNELYLEGSPLTDQDFFSLQKQVDLLINNHESKIILNFESIKLLNSLGINNLIKVMTKCRNHGGELYIVNISDKISHVLLLTKLNTVLNIATSLTEAINKFAIDNES